MVFTPQDVESHPGLLCLPIFLFPFYQAAAAQEKGFGRPSEGAESARGPIICVRQPRRLTSSGIQFDSAPMRHLTIFT